MLELPLHYAYFLFPTGLIMGILNARIHRTALFTTNRTLPLTLWTLGCIAFFLVVADYLRVEASTFALRLEKAQIKALSAAEPPETMLLTQLQANIQLARYEVRPDMTDEELVWMRNVATAFPTVLNLNKLATALAVNSHTEEATLWLRRSCPLLSPDLCEAARRRWADSQKAFPQAAMLPWPEN